MYRAVHHRPWSPCGKQVQQRCVRSSNRAGMRGLAARLISLRGSDMALTPEMEKLGDELVETVKEFVGRSIRPLLTTQRELTARCEKQAQQISALTKQIAALERKQLK